MGFTGLARWVNAPPSGLQLIRENIIVNHSGIPAGKWYLSVKSYRSTLGQIPGLSFPSERAMCALTTDDHVYVLLEDPLAPTRADTLAPPPPPGSPSAAPEAPPAYLQNPTHYRTTFLTLSPPGALDQLLTQLKARWIPIRQASANAAQRGIPAAGQQLTIEGFIFKIGADWLVRVGNVILGGGAVRGMLLEAEYLPLPVLQSPTADGTSELLSNLLTSLLPNIRDAKTVAVTISDAQWEDVLWDREEEERGNLVAEPERDQDDIFVYGDEGAGKKKGDWTGVDRDRRSAFLIIGALRSEGIL